MAPSARLNFGSLQLYQGTGAEAGTGARGDTVFLASTPTPGENLFFFEFCFFFSLESCRVVGNGALLHS